MGLFDELNKIGNINNELFESLQKGKNDFDKIAQEFDETTEKALDIDGLSYFERITLNCQPHKVFRLDWDNYYPIGFADTFLPKVTGYKCKGVRFFDGAKLLKGLGRTPQKFLQLSDSNELISIITCTYPKGVEAEKKKNRVQPSSHEIATFIEINEQKNIDISFKFGRNAKSFLREYFKTKGNLLAFSDLENKIFKTTKTDFQKHFNRTLSHDNMMDFVLKTVGVKSSSAYSNTDKGKFEQYLRDNKIDSFIYKNTCSNNKTIIVQGTIIKGWLELKYLENSQINSITKLKLSEEKNVIAFKRKEIWSKSNLAIATEYNNGICPNLEAPITEEEIIHISNLITEHVDYTKLKGSEKQFTSLNKEIEKQINNPFYADINLCIRLSITEKGKQNTQPIQPLDGRKTIFPINNNISTFTSTFKKNDKPCEIGLDITIDSNGKLKIKHIVSKDYLIEFEEKWKQEIKKRGLDINITELRQQVLDDFTSAEIEHNFFETFIQKTKALLSEQVGGYIEAILSTQKIAKNVWKEGQVNESTWHSNKEELAEEHKKWPNYVQLNPLVGGGTDGVIDEIVGIPMAIKGIYGIATDEKQRKAIKELFTKEGLSKMLDGLKDEVEEIRNDDQKAQHFGAKTTVTVVTMFFGIGFITKTGKLGDAISTVTTKAVKAVSSKVMKTIKELKDWFKYKPKGRKIIEEFREEIGEDIFVESLEEIAEDIDLFDQIKKQPQKFVDGKRFEKNIEKLIDAGDETFLTKIATEAGIPLNELAEYIPLKQVQINLPNGGFTVADNVWVKVIGDDFVGFKYDVIINEVKLSTKTAFTKRQNEFIKDIGNPNVKFLTRSKKDIIDRVIPQGSDINIKSYIRTSGNGTVDGLDDLIIEKIK